MGEGERGRGVVRRVGWGLQNSSTHPICAPSISRAALSLSSPLLNLTNPYPLVSPVPGADTTLALLTDAYRACDEREGIAGG